MSRTNALSVAVLAGLVTVCSLGGCVSDLLRPDVEEDTSTIPPANSVREMWRYRGQAETYLQLGKVAVENRVEQPQCFLSGDIVGVASFEQMKTAVGRLRDQFVRQGWKVDWQSTARPDSYGGRGGPGVRVKNPVDGYIIRVLGGQEQGSFQMGVYVYAPCRE
jgi:hypothetical protein